MGGLTDYQKEYSFLYKFLERDIELYTTVKNAFFPKNRIYPHDVDFETVGQKLDFKINELMQAGVEEQIGGFDLEDLIKSLVAYGHMKQEVGLMLADGYRYISRRQRLKGHPKLQKFVNAVMTPIDLIAAGMVYADDDWLELGRYVRKKKAA